MLNTKFIKYILSFTNVKFCWVIVTHCRISYDNKLNHFVRPVRSISFSGVSILTLKRLSLESIVVFYRFLSDLLFPHYATWSSIVKQGWLVVLYISFNTMILSYLTHTHTHTRAPNRNNWLTKIFLSYKLFIFSSVIKYLTPSEACVGRININILLLVCTVLVECESVT